MRGLPVAMPAHPACVSLARPAALTAPWVGICNHITPMGTDKQRSNTRNSSRLHFYRATKSYRGLCPQSLLKEATVDNRASTSIDTRASIIDGDNGASIIDGGADAENHPQALDFFEGLPKLRTISRLFALCLHGLATGATVDCVRMRL